MATTVTQNETRQQFCERKLKDHFNHNGDFKQEFAKTFNYYLNKFSDIVPKPDMEEFESALFESFKSQYYQGYFIAREFIEHEETMIPNTWLETSNSIIKEQLPEMISEAMPNDFTEQIRTPLSSKLISTAIQNYENVRELLNEVIVDVTLLGSYRAFLDEKIDRGVETPLPSDTSYMGVLGAYNDLTFIDPQKYVTCVTRTVNSENWGIFLWSSIGEFQTKVGEIIIQKLDVETLKDMKDRFLLYQNADDDMVNGEQVYLTFSILQHMPENEAVNLIESVKQRVSSVTGVKEERVITTVNVINNSFNY